MRSQQNSFSQQSPPFLLRFIGQNLPLVLFLLLSAGGMLLVYWFFSPVESSSQAVAAASNLHSAPIYKAVPAKPVLQRLAQSPGPIRIGIISGHSGSDSGAVCEDGLTEAEVNANIAQLVASNLQASGVHVDILEEFDSRLGSFGATAVISIHADSCVYINDLATGFKISGSSYTDSSTLSVCVEQAYQTATQLPFHANTITPHMTDYHAFRTIPIGVPAIIIEVGFMNLDRALITNQADIPATGITRGIQCFLDQRK